MGQQFRIKSVRLFSFLLFSSNSNSSISCHILSFVTSKISCVLLSAVCAARPISNRVDLKEGSSPEGNASLNIPTHRDSRLLRNFFVFALGLGLELVETAYITYALESSTKRERDTYSIESSNPILSFRVTSRSGSKLSLLPKRSPGQSSRQTGRELSQRESHRDRSGSDKKPANSKPEDKKNEPLFGI